MTPEHDRTRLIALITSIAVVLAACGGADAGRSSTPEPTVEQAGGPQGDDRGPCFVDPGLDTIDVSGMEPGEFAGTELTLVAYDSFSVSDGIFEQFEAETGISVSVLTSADTGSMVSEAVLTAGNPVADVMWGIDNTFLCRGLEADIFLPYESRYLESVPDNLELDPHQRVTPVDFSDLCVNVWTDAIDGPAPTAIADLAKPEYASAFVTENPETSAPGMGFLLATIVIFGEEGWRDYWREMADNGVAITAGWTEAYYGEFVAGGGDRALVMSYASSPVAELIFADPPVDVPPTMAVLDSCFRSIEFAGVLNGTSNPRAAALLIDFLLSPTFQEDIPLSMFVFPANRDAALPPEFDEWAPLSPAPLTLAPEVIEDNRDRWTREWTEIVLR